MMEAQHSGMVGGLKQIKNLAVIAIVLFVAAGCEVTGGQKQSAGALLGAAGGGLLGAQFGRGHGQLAATALGTVAGLLIGSSIGKSMDDVDRMKQHQAAALALESMPSGSPATWRNPDTGNYGSVTPVRTYQRMGGMYCREFNQTITVAGKSEQGYGTACRQPDGSWKITS